MTKTLEEYGALAATFGEDSKRQRGGLAELLADAFATIGPGVEKFRMLVKQMGPDNVGYVEMTSLLRSIDTNLTPKVMNIIQAAAAPEQPEPEVVDDDEDTTEEPVTS